MTQQVFSIDAGDPNGFIAAQSPAICYTKAGGLWTKINDTLDNSGWVCLITEPVTS